MTGFKLMLIFCLALALAVETLLFLNTSNNKAITNNKTAHRLENLVNDYLMCSTCGNAFVSQEELDAFIASSHPKLYSCDQCDLKFKTEKELANHKKKWHNH